MAERRWARIESGKIINTEIWDNTPNIPNVTHVEITNTNPMPGNGWDYDGSVFTAPAPIVDNRPYLHVTFGAAEIILGNTVTIDAKLTVDADPNSALVNFNSSRNLTLTNNIGAAARIKLSFTNGTAMQKVLTPKVSGVYTVSQESTAAAQIPQSVALDVFDI